MTDAEVKLIDDEIRRDAELVKVQMTDLRLARAIVMRSADVIPELAKIFRIAALHSDDLLTVGMYVNNRLDRLARIHAVKVAKGE